MPAIRCKTSPDADDDDQSDELHRNNQRFGREANESIFRCTQHLIKLDLTHCVERELVRKLVFYPLVYDIHTLARLCDTQYTWILRYTACVHSAIHLTSGWRYTSFVRLTLTLRRRQARLDVVSEFMRGAWAFQTRQNVPCF